MRNLNNLIASVESSHQATNPPIPSQLCPEVQNEVARSRHDVASEDDHERTVANGFHRQNKVDIYDRDFVRETAADLANAEDRDEQDKVRANTSGGHDQYDGGRT